MKICMNMCWTDWSSRPVNDATATIESRKWYGVRVLPDTADTTAKIPSSLPRGQKPVFNYTWVMLLVTQTLHSRRRETNGCYRMSELSHYLPQWPLRRNAACTEPASIPCSVFLRSELRIQRGILPSSPTVRLDPIVLHPSD